MSIEGFKKTRFSFNLLTYKVDSPNAVDNLIKLINTKMEQLSVELNALHKLPRDDYNYDAIERQEELIEDKLKLLGQSKLALMPPEAESTSRADRANTSRASTRIPSAKKIETYTSGEIQQAIAVGSTPTYDYQNGKARSARDASQNSRWLKHAESRIIPTNSSATSRRGVTIAEPATEKNDPLVKLETLKDSNKSAMVGSTAALVNHTMTLLNQRTCTAEPSRPGF
jgi:hypothetical protein